MHECRNIFSSVISFDIILYTTTSALFFAFRLHLPFGKELYIVTNPGQASPDFGSFLFGFYRQSLFSLTINHSQQFPDFMNFKDSCVVFILRFPPPPYPYFIPHPGIWAVCLRSHESLFFRERLSWAIHKSNRPPSQVDKGVSWARDRPRDTPGPYKRQAPSHQEHHHHERREARDHLIICPKNRLALSFSSIAFLCYKCKTYVLAGLKLANVYFCAKSGLRAGIVVLRLLHKRLLLFSSFSSSLQAFIPFSSKIWTLPQRILHSHWHHQLLVCVFRHGITAGERYDRLPYAFLQKF